jgi:hypothetical protein
LLEIDKEVKKHGKKGEGYTRLSMVTHLKQQVAEESCEACHSGSEGYKQEKRRVSLIPCHYCYFQTLNAVVRKIVHKGEPFFPQPF